jgi:hypothetical protein
MKFQVVLVGSDGLLVGSDRKMPAHVRSNNDHTPIDEPKKFIRSDDGSIICACSGELESQIFARSLVEAPDLGLSDGEWQEHLDSLARSAWVIGVHQLIVVRKGSLDHALWVLLGQHGCATRIDSIQCVGTPSTASFLTANYFPKCATRNLKALAYLALDYAAAELAFSETAEYDLVSITNMAVEWETYTPNHDHIAAVRQTFRIETVVTA